MEGGSRGGDGPGGCGTEVNQWGQGQSPVGGLDDEAKCEIKLVYNCQRFPVENLGLMSI